MRSDGREGADMEQSRAGRYRLPLVGEVSRWLASGPAFLAVAIAATSLIVLAALAAPGPSDASSVRAAGGFLVALVLVLTVPVAVAFLDAGFALLRSKLHIGTWVRVTVLVALSSLLTDWICIGLAWDIQPWSSLVVVFVTAVALWVLVVGWTLALSERRRHVWAANV
jgi:hypothetical protein